MFKVSSTLGVKFLEKVYEKALVHEIRKAGLAVEQQEPITVHYEGVDGGRYDADLLVEGKVLVELKVCRALGDIHLAQCLNYLHATGLRIRLLLNLGTPRLTVRRVIHG